MTSDHNPILPRTRSCPKNGKTHSQKTRLAEIGTVAQRFPGFGSKTFCRMSQIRQNSFPENTFGRNRHCCTKISGFWVQNILSDVPNLAKLIPRKHVWPKMGHQSDIIASKWGQMCIFSARRFWINMDADIF